MRIFVLSILPEWHDVAQERILLQLEIFLKTKRKDAVYKQSAGIVVVKRETKQTTTPR